MYFSEKQLECNKQLIERNEQNEQKDDLLIEWVTEQIEYCNRKGLIKVQNSWKYSQSKWIEILKSGFVNQLMTLIYTQYFLNSQPEPINKNQSFKDLTKSLTQSWQLINKYLGQEYSKGLNQEFIKRQTIFQQKKKNKLNNENNHIQQSVKQLVKLQFYLLVQKHNKVQNNNVVPDEKLMRELDETCESSLLMTENQLQNMPSSHTQLQEQTIQETSFLDRICQLPQQVQQYLVLVVEEIQQNQILINLDQIEQKLKQSQLFNSAPDQTTVIGSKQKYNKKLVFRQIQQINDQNEQLKQKIQLIVQQNFKLQKQLQQNIHQQKRLVTAITKYNDQKQELFEYMKNENRIDVSSLEQFVQLMKHIEQQNQLIENTISQIQQKNYQLETSNAQKIHTINKNALQITKINDQISIYRSKIKDLKSDIEFLDQIVNNSQFNVEFVNSIDVDQQHQASFNRSINIDQRSSFGNVLQRQSFGLQRQSFGNVLRQNKDIYNQKLPQSTYKRNQNSNRILTDSISGFNQRESFNNQKTKTHTKILQTNTNKNDQQNIQPTYEQTQKQYLMSYPSKSSCSAFQIQSKEQEKMIEEQKDRYRVNLMKNLEELYKEISQITNDITSIKEENKSYEKKNKTNQMKLMDLRRIHQAFVQEAFKQ